MRLVLVAIGLATMASSAAAQMPPHYVDDTAGSGINHSYEGGWEFFVGGGVAARALSGRIESILFLDRRGDPVARRSPGDTAYRPRARRLRAPAGRKPPICLKPGGTGEFAPRPGAQPRDRIPDTPFAPVLDLGAKSLPQNGSIWPGKALEPASSRRLPSQAQA